MIKYHVYDDLYQRYIGEFYSKREAANALDQDSLITGTNPNHYRIEEESLNAK